MSRMIDKALTVFPQPLSPTIPSVSTFIEIKGYILHGLDDAMVGEETRT